MMQAAMSVRQNSVLRLGRDREGFYPSTMTETALARISWRERPSCMLFVFRAHQ